MLYDKLAYGEPQPTALSILIQLFKTLENVGLLVFGKCRQPVSVTGRIVRCRPFLFQLWDNAALWGKFGSIYQ